MTFTLQISARAQRVLDKIQKIVALRIMEKFEQVTADPFRFLEHFEGENVYKLRIGDYRALVDINFSAQLLLVRVLDKRGRIYKR